MTRDTRHMTRDMFGGVNILSKFQLPCSYRLWFMILWGKGWLSHWINYEVVYRTAPATPGLLNSTLTQAPNQIQDPFGHHQHLCTSFNGQEQVQTHLILQRPYWVFVVFARHWKRLHFNSFWHNLFFHSSGLTCPTWRIGPPWPWQDTRVDTRCVDSKCICGRAIYL